MSDKFLHIVSFDIPYPVNYGGVIDVYYKIEALHKKGIKVILHNFKYGGRKEEPILNNICHKVYYYPRFNNKTAILSSKPYIVESRSSQKLLNRLASDDYPILFEGLHSCLYLNNERIIHKKRFVRTHNIEHEYYKGLASAEKNPLKTLYFLSESKKLKLFEKRLAKASGILSISKNDELYFKEINPKCYTISAFHPSSQVNINCELGEYALYHGSLDVSENNKAALFLINEVFNDINYPLIIAGNKPSKELKNAAKNSKNIKLLSNLKEEDFAKLISEAQINILPTFQATGVKLKLLLALHNGKHIIVNDPMVKNTGLESLCHIANSAQEIKNKISELAEKNIDEIEIEKRKNILLNGIFSNEKNVIKLIDIIFS